MARDGGGLVGRIQEAATEALRERVGVEVVDRDHLTRLEETAVDYSAMRKELDLLGWTVMDYVSGNPQEVNANSRRKFAQQARVVWEQDPQAGAAVEMLNNFVFGRGVPRPRAKDKKVQEIIDEAWDDPDNQLVLTSYSAQTALGTDLYLQSNVFLVMFDQGDDGKVKLGLLDHDTVENAVRDPDNRLRVLYYISKQRRQEWDYKEDRPKTDLTVAAKTLYYEHWRNVQDMRDNKETPEAPPQDKLAEGRVYHVAVNRRSEQVFGTPTMRRTIRWFTAYNEYLKARVDIVSAAAAFIMKRKVKGTPTQVARLAAKAVSRQSPLAASVSAAGEEIPLGPRTASTITENDGVSHEPFNLNTNAGNAQQDADMLLGQSSMATPFPKHYYGGDPGSLAGATGLELPVLKGVEAYQEVFEQVFRWFLDRVIERAVDTGKLDKNADPSEEDQARQLAPVPDTGAFGPPTSPFDLSAAHEDQHDDEKTTERDLSYEFSMPSPLRRMMTDLVGAVANIAKTFDPNATNMELSKTLLTIALGEGLEVQDPADAVERIFPPGYQDPAIAAAVAAARQAPTPMGPDAGQFGPDGNPQGENNPYGAPLNASPPEQMQQAAITRGRDGEPIIWVSETPVLTPPPDTTDADAMKSLEDQFDEDVASVVQDHLNRLLVTPNGNGHP